MNIAELKNSKRCLKFGDMQGLSVEFEWDEGFKDRVDNPTTSQNQQTRNPQLLIFQSRWEKHFADSKNQQRKQRATKENKDNPQTQRKFLSKRVWSVDKNSIDKRADIKQK